MLRAALSANAPKCANHSPAEPTARIRLITITDAGPLKIITINSRPTATTINMNEVLTHFGQRPRYVSKTLPSLLKGFVMMIASGLLTLTSRIL